LRGNRPPASDNQPLFDVLVLDEASQMNLPEALLAASFLDHNGQMIVVGDHRQMPPILAHNWETEERRTLQEAQPYRSVFEFLRDRGFSCVALDQSFRLHRVQAEFLRQHVYARDGIRLHSTRERLLPQAQFSDPFVSAVLDPHYPIVVVEHQERGSQQLNDLEVELASRLIRACLDTLRLSASDGLGVVVPHRAQKAALARQFPDLAAARAIDTVERFQGGERDVIVVSATASDPAYVLQEASFLLNPNRFTVAISRPRLKLVILASSSVLRLIPGDLEQFENAVLWKRLRFEYAREQLWSGEVQGVGVTVHGRSASTER
jgi:superfamily I DNA and/or RNA helicase